MEKIIRIKETDSTNKIAKDYIRKGVKSGTAIISNSQTAGKGRLGKSWVSVPGKGLYCSIIIRPACKRDQFSLITLVTGLVVADIIEEISGGNAQLKWPNDIILAGKKCAGILCEAVLDQQHSDYVIIGIGININLSVSDIPSQIASKTTSMAIVAGNDFDINDTFNKVYHNLLKAVDEYCEFGFSQFYENWRKRDFLQGKKTSWCTVSKDVVVGKAIGLARNGEYHIQDDNGNLHEVLSGDLTQAEK